MGWSRERVVVMLVGLGTLASPMSGIAGPWSSLPEAVDRLHQRPGDRAAEQVLQDVEASLLAEAEAGRLEAVKELITAYQNLVAPLADGERRCEALHVRTSDALAAFGDGRRASEPRTAGRAWALAVGLAPSPGVLERLRSVLLPPAVAEPGAVWRSPIDGAELVYHPPMQFTVGCNSGDDDCLRDESGRWVQAADVWVERTEVTNRRYRACVQDRACSPPVESEAFGEPDTLDLPVVGVTWPQALQYARWAGRRLPSEVEWERAARGLDPASRFPWGKGRDRGLANLEGTAEADQFGGLAPAASFPPTGYGLYDLAGNVWEWCADSYHGDLRSGPSDEKAWDKRGFGRMLRGGSWRRTIEVARVSARMWLEDEDFTDDIGFRSVTDVPSRVDERQLGELAQRAFPMPEASAGGLEGTSLAAADRRYLERMSLTWLVLEGRLDEAMPRAVTLVRRDPHDPVALDLLERLENEMTEEVQQGDVAGAESVLQGYRAAVNGDRRLASRLAQHEQRLLDQLRVSVDLYLERSDPGLLAVTVRFARMLDPGDPILQTLTASEAHAPGTVRAWPRDGRAMVWIPAGSFRLGASPNDAAAAYDEHPAHQVNVDGFWLDRAEVTNDDYRACVNARACSRPRRTIDFDDPAKGDLPVLWVEWFQAKAYAAWAGKRLPTEAEWEYAARAGSTTRFPWGHEWVDGQVNALGAVVEDRWAGLAPVGSLPANGWGVYDLLGNASEWVQDVYHRNYWEAPKDARGWIQISGGLVERKRVVRGGDYLTPANRQRVSVRDARAAEGNNRTVGFRCAADP